MNLNLHQYVTYFFFCCFTLLLASCGGSSGGSVTPISLASGSFTKSLEPANEGSWSGPFTGNTAHEQHLFFADDIKGSGYIQSFALRYNADSGVDTSCSNVTIKMGHTGLSALTTTFANNVEQGKGSLETVYTGAITVPAGVAGDYFTLTLDTPFHYNGVENLVVEFLSQVSCSAGVILDATTSGYADVTLHSASTGNTTGALYAEYLNAKFNFEGGDNQQNMGGAVNNLAFGFSAYREQILYLANEIDGSGPITGLAFQAGQTTVAGSYTFNIKMGHTTLSSPGSTYADNYSDTPVTVANAVTVNIPAGIPAGEWFWVPLPDSVFTYNGNDNLIIDMDITSGTANNYARSSSVANRRAIGASGATTASSIDNTYFHVKLRFHGGAMDAGIGATSVSSQILESDADGAEGQLLYHASELGTGGTINSISLRMNNSSNVATHPNYVIRMGHTSKDTLIPTDTYVSNMDENTEVYNGTLDVPAGLLAGDWLTIPINGFNYDSTKNLAIYFSTGGTTGGGLNIVKWNYSVIEYPGRMVGSETGGGTIPAWSDDGILEIRLGIEK